MAIVPRHVQPAARTRKPFTAPYKDCQETQVSAVSPDMP
jgi:hypothetical protein